MLECRGSGWEKKRFVSSDGPGLGPDLEGPALQSQTNIKTPTEKDPKGRKLTCRSPCGGSFSLAQHLFDGLECTELDGVRGSSTNDDGSNTSPERT
jgi:hypothetical protein